MRSFTQLVVILVALSAFGLLKLSFEQNLHASLLEEKLIHPPMKNLDRRELGQVGAAAVLGGMRSPIASIENLRAFNHFENLDWPKVEKSYQIITALQPQTTHYWDTGAWHLHTNASVYYQENKDLSPLRRKALRKQYIDKGSALLEEGVRQNPQNWRLHLALARLWSDRYKFPDFPRSVKHYDDALATDTMPDYKRSQYQRFHFYTLARIPGRQAEALKEGTQLFRETPRNHLPNLVCTVFALQHAVGIPETERIPDSELFPNEKAQLKWLGNYWGNRDIDFPMNGVKEKLRTLEKKPH